MNIKFFNFAKKFLRENNFKTSKNIEGYKSYVYIISDNKKWYIGSRKSRESDILIDFWNYGTSSIRKEEILSNKELFNVKIISIFRNYKRALLFEVILHNYLNVASSRKFWNIANARYEGYCDCKNTVSVYDTLESKYKRVNSEEYFNNIERYKAPSKNMITVRLRDSEKYFNIPRELYNPQIHLTTGANKVLARRRGTNERYKKIPKDVYNKEDYETPGEVKNRPENKGKTAYHNLETDEVEYFFESPGLNWRRLGSTYTFLKNNKIASTDFTSAQKRGLEKANIPYVTVLRDGVFRRVKEIHVLSTDIIYESRLRSVSIDGSEFKTIPRELVEKLREEGHDVKSKGTIYNSVNVLIKSTGVRTKISREEFYKNREKYISLGGYNRKIK